MILTKIKKKNVQKLQNFTDLNPVIGICGGYSQGLRNLPLSMSAQVLVVFEI